MRAAPPALTAVLAAGLALCGPVARASADDFLWNQVCGSNEWYATMEIDDDPVEYVNNWGRKGNPPAFPDLAGDVVIGGSAALGSGTEGYARSVSLSGSLYVHGNSLRVSGTSFGNTGTLTLESQLGFGGGVVEFDDPNSVLSGGGTVHFIGGALQGHSGNEHLTTDNTIHGSGGLSGFDGVTNNGLIHADVDGTGVGVTAGSIDNNATCQASNGATLSLWTDGAFDNTGGTIQCMAGSSLKLTASVVTGGAVNVYGEADWRADEFTGGTLYNSGTVTVDSLTARLDANVTNAAGGRIIVDGGSVLVLTDSGSFDNAGQLRLEGNSTFAAYLRVSGTVTLAGGGGLVLGGESTANRVEAEGTSAALTNADHSISGVGDIGCGELAIVNHGLIHANVAGQTLELNPADAAGMVNTGTLRASGGATLKIHNDTLTNTGGLIDVRVGSKLELQDVTITGGRLDVVAGAEADMKGNCTFSGEALANAGTIDVYWLTADAAVTNAAGGVIRIGRLAPAGRLFVFEAGGLHNDGLIEIDTGFVGGGDYGALVCSGTVTLTGGGTIVLKGDDRIRGAGATLVNTANTIEGRGLLGDDELALVNHGLIHANTSADTLTVNPGNGDALVNTGTMQASGGGILYLTDAVVDNTGGVIQALAGSHLRVSNVGTGNYLPVTGGTVRVLAATAELTNMSFADGTLHNTGVIEVDGWSKLERTAVTNASGAQIVVNSDDRLYLTDVSDLDNAGEIVLESGADLLLTGTTRLTGGGTLRLAGGEVAADGPGPETLVNVDQTIHGAGNLGGDELALTNQATIDADVPGERLNVDPDDTAGMVNTGVVQASGGGILSLRAGTLTNTGGTIRALTGSEVRLEGYSLSDVTIVGGTLATSGTGVIRTGGGDPVLQDLANTGLLRVDSGDDLTLVGTLANSGQVDIMSAGSTTRLLASGTVTLSVGGGVTLSDNTANRIEAIGGSGTLINTDNTISGAGRLGYNELTIVNTGTIAATGVNRLEVDADGTAGMTNDGAMRAVGAGGLYFKDDAFTNAGNVEVLVGSNVKVGSTGNGDYVQTAGTTRLEGGLLEAGNLHLQGGHLRGTGTIDGHLHVTGGTAAPGLSCGLIEVVGDVTFAAGGGLDVEIAAACDRLDVTGQAALDGTLSVGLAAGYLPEPATTFTVLACGSRTGQFAVATGLDDLGGFAGLDFVLTYEADAVKLAASAHSGDANLDAVVDVLDLARLANNFGATGATWRDADFNGDGVVDVLDLAAIANNFGWTAGGATPPAGGSQGEPVPEPTLLGLLLSGAGGLLRRRRSR